MSGNLSKPQPFFALTQPLEAVPGARQMRIANLGAFPQLARDLGANPQALLERYAIDPLDLHCPDRLIDCKTFTELLEDTSRSCKAPLLGLKLAQLHEPDVYGCVIALCRAAPTMRDAIACFAKYIQVTHSPASTQQLVESEHNAELRWHVHADLGVNQQANYHAALLMMKLLRQIGGSRFRPSYVVLAVDARDHDIAAAEKYFGCRFHIDKTLNAIAFPREFLQENLISASRPLFSLLGGYLDKIKASTEVALAQHIENYIRAALPAGRCSIDLCAQALGMAVRTLQTKLNAAGCEFSAILERQRFELAKTYLQQNRLSLYEIAANLGYTEQSSFNRAFKRWAGATPRQYQQRYSTGGGLSLL